MNTRPRLGGMFRFLALASLVLSATPVRSQAPGPVFVEILADQNRNSPDPLEPFDVRFIVYANGNKIQGMVFGLILRFSNGNFIGTIDEWPKGHAQVVYSAQTKSTFASIAWNTMYGQGVDPDTMLLGLTSFSAPWTGAGEMFRIHVTPTDTGSLEFDSIAIIPPGHGGLNALDPLGASLPVVVIGPPIHVPPQPDPVRFRFATNGNSDTLYQGSPARIFMNVDAMGNAIHGIVTVLHWKFTNGNVVGPFNSDLDQGVTFSNETVDAFESRFLLSMGSYAGGGGTSPDTSVGGFTSFDATRYTANSWIWSVDFVPPDTGTIVLATDVYVPPVGDNISALDSLGFIFPSSFIPGRMVVLPCPYPMMGDVNQDALITSSDLIYFINYIFKSGPDPLPHRSVGDVNCSGGLGGADIIYLVNHIFKSGAPPCACIVRRI